MFFKVASFSLLVCSEMCKRWEMLLSLLHSTLFLVTPSILRYFTTDVGEGFQFFYNAVVESMVFPAPKKLRFLAFIVILLTACIYVSTV